MTETPLRLAVVVGSVREGRFGPTVVDWFAEQAKRHGRFKVDVIDLAELPLPVVLPGFGGEPDPETTRNLQDLSERLGAADAFVVVTPEYNHSVPASLKNAIDWTLPVWQTKPVGLISYGGQGGGIRAAEHLRQIFPELHAITVRDALSFHNAWDIFGEDGQPKDLEGSIAAAKGILGQLDWWGSVLRDGRAQRPYTV